PTPKRVLIQTSPFFYTWRLSSGKTPFNVGVDFAPDFLARSNLTLGLKYSRGVERLVICDENCGDGPQHYGFHLGPRVAWYPFSGSLQTGLVLRFDALYTEDSYCEGDSSCQQSDPESPQIQGMNYALRLGYSWISEVGMNIEMNAGLGVDSTF